MRAQRFLFALLSPSLQGEATVPGNAFCMASRFAYPTLFALALALAAPGWSQTLRPEQLMVMVVGASAQKPDADEQAIVARLKQLKGQQPALAGLKMATMHFDRPKEAELGKKLLGLKATDLPCLCLVQLDAKGQRPVRNLYSMPRVTRSTLDQVESVTQQWAFSAGTANTAEVPTFPTARPTDDPGNPSGSVPEQTVKTFSFSIPGGGTIPPGGSLVAPLGRFRLLFGTDGKLSVLDGPASAQKRVWHADADEAGSTCTLGLDGVLRIISRDGNTIWSSHSPAVYGRYNLQIQDDGNAVIYRYDRGSVSAVWSSGTALR